MKSKISFKFTSEKGYEPFGNTILKHSGYFGSAPLRSDFAKMGGFKISPQQLIHKHVGSNLKETLEITKKDIEKLIELRKENTFLNHLRNVFSRDFRPKGEIRRNEIKIWKQSMWNVTFYPVFAFELNANNHLINITDKLNPIGKTFIGILLTGILFLIVSNFNSGFDFLENWLPILIVVAFLLVLGTVFRKIYLFEKQNQLDEIFEFLDIEIEEKKPEKEWSLKNIIIRLFTYPFCLFLIGLNIFLIIPNGQYILAMGTFVLVGFYLFADLKMILKK